VKCEVGNEMFDIVLMDFVLQSVKVLPKRFVLYIVKVLSQPFRWRNCEKQ
jgi:hypothetical protein